MAALQMFAPPISKAIFDLSTTTHEYSKNYIKQMLPIAVSYILYQRIDLGREHFESHSWNGIPYKIFKNKSNCALKKSIQAWIMGAYDAFDKNYLREMYSLICNKQDPTHIIESYKFQFRYMGNNEIPFDSSSKKEELVTATANLLRKIGVLPGDKFEEDDIQIQVVLTFYDDETPNDYVPPFYENSTDTDWQTIKYCKSSKFSFSTWCIKDRVSCSKVQR